MSLALSIQLSYYILFWLSKPKSISQIASTERKVSIIICAKNEAQRLQRHLIAVLEQDYPKDWYEVLVVDDGSTDDTLLVLRELQQKYPQLQILSNDLKSPLPGKKSALDCGIRRAKHDYLLLTDSDCRPNSKHWLRLMTNTYENNSIVIGYGAYEKKTTALNRFIQWETAHTFMQYASYAQIGKPYMAVGRNVAYPKTAYFKALESTAFLQTYQNVPSGDDDLLLQEMAKTHKVQPISDPLTHTISEAPEHFQTWLQQKTRHVSTGKYYLPQLKIYLGIYAFTQQIMWIIYPIFAIYFGCTMGLNQPIFGILLLGFLVRLTFVQMVFSEYNQQLQSFTSTLYYGLGDLLWAGYNLLLSPYIFFKNKKQWK